MVSEEEYGGVSVPNAPCGVERWAFLFFLRTSENFVFLMHRVELKGLRKK